MTLRSAIYLGHVWHRRHEPRHAFRFPLFMVLLDLAEIQAVMSLTRLWGTSRWSAARFVRDDFLRHRDLGLDASVRSRVQEVLGRRPAGPVRMLAHLRYFGYVFNPVTFYYCYDERERLDAVVAEITNTPWKERHAYVLDARSDEGIATREWSFPKQFHVSPFMPMDASYRWRLSEPLQVLRVWMRLARERGELFDAALVLRRREITAWRLRLILVRYPFMTARVIAMIYWNALRLRLKRAPVFPHPSRSAPSESEAIS